MSPKARERFLEEVLDALSDPRSAMSEGRPHKKAKTRTLDLLNLHFKAMGRVVYLAEEMAVVYPGEEPFSPDVLAVVGVAEPEDDQRMAWVVADERKGLDLVLEVLHHGNRKKDLVDNVERYARLGIPEYFVYDHGMQRIRGYRLPVSEEGAKPAAGPPARYLPIVPQGGRYTSAVLGLDLGIREGSLCFFQGMAELFGSAELIRRLNSMVRDQEAKLEEAEARAAKEATQVGQPIAGLRLGILAMLDTRKIPVSEELRARVMGCEDIPTLQEWLGRTISAMSAEAVVSAEGAR